VRAASPAAVLALQRTAGNRAVANLLQRQEKTEVTGPGDFGVAGGEPKSSGNTQVSPAPGDKARIVSPDVKFSAKVWLNDDKKLGASANLGYIQNLAKSDRGAVYRRGGDPAGEVVAEDHTGLSNRWDAVNDPTAEEQRGEMVPAAGVFPPFYWKPSSIGDANDKTDPVETDPAAHDQPEFSKPVKNGPGRITQFKGKDEFKLGLAVKKGETIHMLRAYDWEISWDANVDANVSGAGRAVESVEVIDALNDGPNTSLTDWSLDPKAGDPFEGFATVAEAMKRTPAQLMNWLLAAQKHDQVTYRNICAALDAKDPTVAISVTCDKTHDLVGRDHVHVRAEGAGASAGRTVHLKEREPQELSLSIKEMFGSAGAITAGSTVLVEVSHMDGPEGQATFGMPLSGAKKLTVGDGTYTATLAVA
jgi:hypothetical protein